MARSAAGFVVGAVIAAAAAFALRLSPAPEEADDWRNSVAEYVAL